MLILSILNKHNESISFPSQNCKCLAAQNVKHHEMELLTGTTFCFGKQVQLLKNACSVYFKIENLDVDMVKCFQDI